MPNTVTKSLTYRPTEATPDSAVLQSVINRRLALRLTVSLPVAATYAALAGIGPQSREARR